jgi:DNA-directed RNA polymerase specialized sigma24 family protein
MKLALETPTAQLILGALRSGDTRRAATLVVEAFAPRAYQLCRLATVSAEQAEELAYRALAAAVGDLSELRHAPTAGQWLLSRVRQVCREELLGSALPAQPLATRALPPANQALRPSPDELRGAYAQLPPEARAALALSGLCEVFEQPVAKVAANPAADPPAPSADAERELAAGALAMLRGALAREGSSPAAETLCELLVELRWPVPDGLKRRLTMLCAAL